MCIRIEFLSEGALNQGVLEESVFHGVVDDALKQGVIYGGPFWPPSPLATCSKKNKGSGSPPGRPRTIFDFVFPFNLKL